MASHTIGSTIRLNGEKEYRAALKEIAAEQKNLTSEMELSAAEFEGQNNSLEALERQYDLLGKSIEAQGEKIGYYEGLVEKAAEKQAAMAKQVEDCKDKLSEEQESLEKLKNSTEASTEEIAAQEKAVLKAEEALERANVRYVSATTAVNNWEVGLNNAKAEMIRMQGELENTGKYIEEAKNAADGCATSIDGMGKELKEGGEHAATFGEVLKANLASDVIVKGLEKIADFTKKCGEGLFELATNAAYAADDIMTLSTNTGIATDTIQALRYSEELLDTSVETVTSSMAKNIRSMQSAREGSEAYAETYRKLGVSVTDANGNLRDSETVFWEVIDALGGISNATERDAVSMQIFGRNAQSLNSLIAAGSKGFKEMYREADRLGYIMDNETLSALVDTSDAMERVSKTADAIKNQIGADVAPVVNEAAEEIQRLMIENADKVEEIVADVIPALVNGLEFVVNSLDTIIPITEGVVTGFLAFKAATAATTALNAVTTALSTALENTTIKQAALNAVQSVSPMGAVAAAAGLLVTALGALIANTDKYTPKVYELSDAEQEVVDNMNRVTSAAREHGNAFETSITAMAANKTQAEQLVGRLRELEPAAKNDAEKMAEMRQVVAQLNGIMPEMGLAIDETTGSLNMGIDAIEGYTAALMRQIEQEAYSERLTEIIQDKIDIQNQLIEGEEAYNEAIRRVNEAAEARNAAVDAYNEALEHQGELTREEIWELGALADAARENFSEVAGATEDTRAGYQALQGQLEELDGQYAQYQELLSNTAPQEDAAAALGELSSETVKWRGYLVEATGDASARIAELNEKYLEAKASAEDSLRSQMGLFEEFSVKSASIGDMTNAMQSQTTAMAQYGDNLQRALDLDIDPQIIADIEEMGMSGAGYLQALVDAAEEGGDAFSDFVEAWRANQEAFDELSSSMAEFEVGFSEAVGIVVEDATTATEDMTAAQEEFSETYVRSWEEMGSGAADAVLEAIPTVTANVEELTTAALSTMNAEFGIGEDGRSRAGFEAGQSFGRSIAEGIADMEDEIVSAVTRVGDAAVAEARSQASRIDEALGEML